LIKESADKRGHISENTNETPQTFSASEMTFTASGGALNSIHSPHKILLQLDFMIVSNESIKSREIGRISD